MRLAYFSPLNPQKSGISDYSEELLPALAKGAEIDLFVDGFSPSNKALADLFEIHDYRKRPECLDTLDHYDAVVCQMGNNHRYHRGIYEVATRNAAIIVFHDIAFQHFFLERARELRDYALYLDELEASEGVGIRVEAEEAIARGEAPPQYQNPLGFPMNFRLANQAEGIIVHSEWSRSRLERVAPGVPVVKIEHHVKIPGAESHTAGKNEGERLSIASFGFITASKGFESALRALAALRPDHKFHYYLVGEPDSYFDIHELTRLYGVSDCVSITGYVSFDEFNRRIAHTDIALNLRDQTVGETSGSLCRLMAAAVPTLVSNIGWFSELPDDCLIKIGPGPDADLLICAYLKELSENPDLRRQIGANARALMETNHSVEQTAADYLEFVSYVIARRANRAFVESVSADLARLSNVEPNELLLGSVARSVTDLLSP
ncbi:MAG TPA: glycosyltransferase family 4 protein [Pyrinomonadaceae bacterium]|nr:glycosyltransferase family 4 protein [Pyrinomonadaceae bacterium]